MTIDRNQTEDYSDAGEGEDAARVAMPDTGGMDTTMAAGTPSGAAGVANAELGTSGPPAEDLLTAEELAQTEVTGGAGLNLEGTSNEQLEEYLGSSTE